MENHHVMKAFLPEIDGKFKPNLMVCFSQTVPSPSDTMVFSPSLVAVDWFFMGISLRKPPFLYGKTKENPWKTSMVSSCVIHGFGGFSQGFSQCIGGRVLGDGESMVPDTSIAMIWSCQCHKAGDRKLHQELRFTHIYV